jgi:hypothetical protein
VTLKAAARELGGGLAVDFQFKRTSGSDGSEIQTSVAIAHGQSIVMKASRCRCEIETKSDQKSGARPAVYVVLTPELVR